MYKFHQAMLKTNEDKVSAFKTLWSEWLKYMIDTISSTKNALLLDQKRVSDPVEIAYRDWAIHLCDIIINKMIKSLDDLQPKKPIY